MIIDVWGDSVNTASRMESNGHPGAVHISEETYRNIKHLEYLHAECCGETIIKGKGCMTTYIVTKILSDEDEDEEPRSNHMDMCNVSE